MPLPPLTSTRDLVHYRKVPPRQTALLTVANAYLSLLSSTDHPAAASLRTVFFPALTGSDLRPRDPSLLAQLDANLVDLFRAPPAVVLLQATPSADTINDAWKSANGEAMRERVFVAFSLHTEMENAKAEDDRESVANLSMMVIATLTFELAQWISVKMRGYRSTGFSTDAASMRTTTTGISVTSIHSTGSNGPLVPHRNPNDVGTRAVLGLVGCDYELLAYILGSSQVVKRRYPTRRSAVLTPPVVFFLLGDTPAIIDVTAAPPTVAGWVPPHKEGDSMYAVTSVLTPAGVARMHGECVLVESGAPSSAGGSSVQVNLQGMGDDGEKVFDPMYGGI
ncbi:hypothetical protein JCM10207_001636 [Rhodosporidiobolus poonsookiae]